MSLNPAWAEFTGSLMFYPKPMPLVMDSPALLWLVPEAASHKTEGLSQKPDQVILVERKPLRRRQHTARTGTTSSVFHTLLFQLSSH